MHALNYLDMARSAGRSISLANLRYDPVKRQLTCDAVEVELEPKSRDLLERLLRQVGEPVSNDELIRTLWGSEHLSRNVLTNRIGALRTTLNAYLKGTDASKLIVTYPRQGYLIDNAWVSLVGEPEAAPESVSADADAGDAAAADDASAIPSHIRVSSIVPDLKKRRGFPPLAWVGIAASLCVGLFLVLFQDAPQTNAPREAEAQVSAVRLVMGRLRIQNEAQEPLRQMLKATLMSRLMASPLIDLKNLDAPDFFIAGMESGESWPGFPVLGAVDYQLNAYVQHDHEGGRAVEGEAALVTLELVVPQTHKAAFSARYHLTGFPTASQLGAMSGDLGEFLSVPSGKAVPAPADYGWMALSTRPLLEALASGRVSEIQGTWLARRVLREWPAEPDILPRAITLLEREFGQPSGEMGIWLGLLHGLREDFTEAAALLDRSGRRHSVDNAFVYFNRAYYAQQVGDMPRLESNYLHQLWSLQYGLPTHSLFQRLAAPENAASCQQPWDTLLPDKLPRATPWLERIEHFCQGLDAALKPAP